MENIQTIYADYRQASKEARQKSTILADFLGTSDSAKKAPCHLGFYQQMETWLAEFLAADPSPEAAKAVVGFVLTEPENYKGKDCYWYMYTVIGLLLPLIPVLTPADAGTLYGLMGKLYRRQDRMPAIDKVYKALAKRAKG